MTVISLELGRVKKVTLELNLLFGTTDYTVAVYSSEYGNMCVGRYDNLADAETKFKEMLKLTEAAE